MDDDRTDAVLNRIAQALGVPADVFRVANDTRDEGNVSHAVSEELELLRLFQAVGDPTLRRACLDFVRDATRSDDLATG